MQNKIDLINKTIEQLKSAGADFDDRNHFASHYKRYLKKFDAAKKLLQLNNYVKAIYPLENPIDMLKHLYWTDCTTKEEREDLLWDFNRTRAFTFDVSDMFSDLDREDFHNSNK